jgi:hypothetical protein
MKKVMSALLCIMVSATLLAGCNLKGKTKVDNGDPVTGEKPGTTVSEKNPGDKKDNEGSKTDKVVPGTEITTFMTGYMDTKTKLWDGLSKEMEKSQNLSFALSTIGFAFADLVLVEVMMFDALSDKSGDIVKGRLMFSGIEAWKKTKGDMIEFGYDYVYPEDKNQAQKGDRELATGKFDKKADSLVYKKHKERDGKQISMYVVEVTRNAANSYSAQIYMVNSQEDEDQTDKRAGGYFTWFEGENIITVYAEKDNAGDNISYESIFGRKNMKPEDMTKGMKVQLKASFVNGKIEYEEINN